MKWLCMHWLVPLLTFIKEAIQWIQLCTKIQESFCRFKYGYNLSKEYLITFSWFERKFSKTEKVKPHILIFMILKKWCFIKSVLPVIKHLNVCKNALETKKESHQQKKSLNNYNYKNKKKNVLHADKKPRERTKNNLVETIKSF